MPKATSPMAARQARRHNPLDEDLLARGLLKQKAPKRTKSDKDEDGDGYVDAKASKRILQLGRELETEGNESASSAQKLQPDAFGSGTRFDEEEQEVRFEDDDGDDAWADEDAEVTAEADPVDLATFNKFLPTQQEEDPILKHGLKLRMTDGEEEEEEEEDTGMEAQEDAQPGRNLADIILAKIAEHEAGLEWEPTGGPNDGFDEEDEMDIDPRLVEVYTKCGMLLSRWKSGKLPKPIKVLPTAEEWETLLEIAQPYTWSANACYEVTKIFISAKVDIGRTFMELAILPRVRHEIHETKKLNVHLFAALKRSLFRPDAFFKGFLLPLLESGTTTLREAQIVSAVLVRTSIPVGHSASALMALCDIAAQIPPGREDQSAISVFIKALIDKRYALPFEVVDALVEHFLRARTATTAMPVIWQQSLLLFAQRYRDSITSDQRKALMELLKSHGHATIGPEIRRELLAGRERGAPAPTPTVGYDGDDTMVVDP